MTKAMSDYYVEGCLAALPSDKQSHLRQFAVKMSLLAISLYLVLMSVLYLLSDAPLISAQLQAIYQMIVVIVAFAALHLVLSSMVKRPALLGGLYICAALVVWFVFVERTEGLLVALLPYVLLRMALTLPARQFLGTAFALLLFTMLALHFNVPSMAGMGLRYFLASFCMALLVFLAIRYRELPQLDIQKKIFMAFCWMYISMGPLFMLSEQLWPVGASAWVNTLTSLAAIATLLVVRIIDSRVLRVAILLLLVSGHLVTQRMLDERSIILLLPAVIACYLILPRLIFLLFIFVQIGNNAVAILSINDVEVIERLGLFVMASLVSWVMVSTLLPLWLQDSNKKLTVMTVYQQIEWRLVPRLVGVFVAIMTFIGLCAWPLINAITSKGLELSLGYQWQLMFMLWFILSAWFALNYLHYSERRHQLLLNKQQADKAAEQKANFLSVLSHEMRTPLNGLMGMMQVVELQKNIPAEFEKPLQLVRYNSHQLYRLVEDVLDATRFENKKLDLLVSDILLSPMVSGLVKILQMDAEVRHINLSIESYIPRNTYASIDEQRVHQVIEYFAAKLFEQCSEGDRVCIRFAVSRNTIEVTFESPHAEQFYAAWCRGLDSDEFKQRMGFMVELLSLLQAHIELVRLGDNQALLLQCGAVLKRVETSADHRHLENVDTVSSPPITGIKLLVVDDDQVNRSFIEFAMKKEGAVVDTVSTGAEALMRLGAEKYDVVITDMSMPLMSGDQLLTKIRELGVFVPVLAVTGNDDAMNRQHYMDMGFADVMPKPLNMNILRKKINRLR